jgi:hypothetical protein
VSLSADLASMLLCAPDAVDVVFGALKTKGVLDHETTVQDMGDQMAVLGSTLSLGIRTASLPGLKKASSVSVGGVAYKVRELRKVDDGLITRVFLEVA